MENLSLERIYRRDEIIPAAEAIVNRLLEEESSKEALTKIFVLKQVVETAEKTLRVKALEKLDGKKEVVQGVELSSKNLPAVWDYTGCNDSLLAQLETDVENSELALKADKEKLSERRKFLQILKAPVADTETGEIINPARLVEQGQTIVVQFLKGA